uniref:cytochrome c3 family protein n=1 Tax=Novosphingobium rosa TaxID=76978 RepID=UPI000A657D10
MGADEPALAWASHYPDKGDNSNRPTGPLCDGCHSVNYNPATKAVAEWNGSQNEAMLRKPVTEVCLSCHGPNTQNGPHTDTIEAHTHHLPGSPGSRC